VRRWSGIRFVIKYLLYQILLTTGGGFKVARVSAEKSADLSLIGQPIKKVNWLS
jgi:hypothetical protein